MDEMDNADKIDISMNYLKQLEGMKYVMVRPETDHLISNGPPFWNDVTKLLPKPGIIYKLGSCCTALANIVRRLNGLPIPGNISNISNENCVGGTDSWFKYLITENRLHKIDHTKAYPKGALLIQDYNPIDQGHVALLFDNGNTLLESSIIHNIGSYEKKYNKVVIEKFSDYTNYQRFTHISYPKDWIFKV